MERNQYIINFASHLGKEMLICGANLERVNITLESILRHYGVKEFGIHALSTVINISCSDDEGKTISKVVKIPGLNLNMEKLRLLTNLYKKIIDELPDPSLLDGMLNDVLNQVPFHPDYVVFIGFILAMGGLARLFGGTWQDVLVSLFNTVLMYFLSKLYNKTHINHILSNFISMFIAGCIAGGLASVGFVKNFYVIVLTNAFFLIPGIPLVNSVRNIICGNEMNGLVELFKVILESLTIVAGSAASYFIFEKGINLALEAAFPATDYTYWLMDAEWVVLSFIISFGFGLTFHISWKEVTFAGIGAMLVRIVYIALLIWIPDYRFLVMLLAGGAADVFSEILGTIKKRPATYYLYTFVVPLLPGDLIAFSMFGIVWKNGTLFTENIISLLTCMLGICVGCVLASSILHYVRKIKLFRKFNLKTSK